MKPTDLIWQLIEDNHKRFESKHRTDYGAYLKSKNNSYKIGVMGSKVTVSQIKANIKITSIIFYDTSEDEIFQVDLDQPDSLQIITDWLTGI